MKGLILSGGYGTRLRPLTYSQQKQLIPVANKPVLFYGIEDLIEAGIKEIGIIVGPNKEQVIEAVRSVGWDAEIEFIHQDEPRGLAHTIKIAKDWLDGQSFAMYLGDNILREGVVKHVKEFEQSEFEASIMLNEVPNPHEFGIAELNGSGEIIRVVEKPKNPPTNLAVIGVYLFRPAIFRAVEEIKPSWRNQLEITDAIQWLIDRGHKVKSAVVSGWWKDTGKPDDIIHASHLVLDELKPDGCINSKVKAKLIGRVQVGEETIIDANSVVKGPVIIGKKCVIKNACIGPYTSIGNDCEITGTEIDGSVVMNDCKLINAGKIVDSLVGKGVNIRKKKGYPKGLKLVIGDHSEVSL